MEIWKTVDEYEGYYQVSNLGRVKSIERIVHRIKDGQKQTVKERILKPFLGNRGYYTVRLTIDGRGRTVQLHGLVAKAFVQNVHNFPVVNHKDGNKLNNNASNLEWTTQKENIRHAWEIGLVKRSKAYMDKM